MILSSLLPAWLRQAPTSSLSYTAEEVRSLLRPGAVLEPRERAEAVLATAAVPGAWTHRLRDDHAWQIGWHAQRLPAIVYFYASGLSLQEISDRIGSWSPWEVDRALGYACGCIASRLNDRSLPAVRGASQHNPRGRA
jgi:hypothetical protein